MTLILNELFAILSTLVNYYAAILLRLWTLSSQGKTVIQNRNMPNPKSKKIKVKRLQRTKLRRTRKVSMLTPSSNSRRMQQKKLHPYLNHQK